MDFDKDFEQSLNQLMRILKKIIGQSSLDDKSPAELLKMFKDAKSKNPNVNIFFLNMSPLDPEEFDEMMEEGFEILGEAIKQPELKCELNDSDQAFLKQNGIKF